MTIRHLKIFTAVADEKGMSAAARKLHISQPSVSQAVSELENYYGVKLFERLSQKLYLTGEGELMLSFSRHILDSFEQMEETMMHAGEGTRLHIGCSVSVGTCLINDVLDKMALKMPECEISVTVSNSTAIEKAILSNEVDVGIVEGILRSPELTVISVCRDELLLVCGRSHPLATETVVTYDMLEGADYISREIGSSDRNQLERIFEEKGLHLKRTFRSTNTEAIKNAVICGRGLAIMSSRMVEKECREGSMVALKLEGEPVTRDIQLAFHRNKYLSGAMKVLLEVLLEPEKEM